MCVKFCFLIVAERLPRPKPLPGVLKRRSESSQDIKQTIKSPQEVSEVNSDDSLLSRYY